MNKKQREAITAAWSMIDRAVDHSFNSASRSLWGELNKETLEHEKGHRNMGRRFTRGRAGYKESANLTAKYFAVRAIMNPHRPRALRELSEALPADMYRAILLDLAGVRSDIVHGAMLHAILLDEVTKNATVSRVLESFFELEAAINSIDYVKDIAA
jgi:hypothetical protein